ncbi:MAG: glucosaminidase domain-containing protein [Bacteroidia bacterium]|nr:glucosaminidase domain-containing protein [Bacteroidia bacterium]
MLSRNDYITLYKSLAIKATQNTGLFPSVMLAQAIVESNNGNSLLASKYNNHFGIKASKSWTGKKVNLNTREVINGYSVSEGDYFRIYDSVEDSYIDRVNFLKQNPRYVNAGVFSAKTPLQQLQALQSAGYATDPNYAEILNSVLVRENLGILDSITSYASAYTKKYPFVVFSIVILTITLIVLLYKKYIA